MRRDVVGVVLAGGRSRRMGRDKALLDLDGQALVGRAAGVLASICAETVLAVGQGRRYPQLSLTHVEDRRADCGPLAGLEAALAWAVPRAVLVLACDLPRVERALLERLLLQASEARLAVGGEAASTGAAPVRDESPRAWLACRGERLQPLCGVYTGPCGSVFRRLLDDGERSVLAAVARIDSRPVAFDDIEPDPFLNVNTPADYVSAGGEMGTR